MLQETVSNGFVKRLFSNLNWQVFLKSYKKKKSYKINYSSVFFPQVLYGADMALRDNDGYTPLHLAAREGHVEAFKEMLRKGTLEL